MVDWTCSALAAALERWNRRDPAARRAPPAEPSRRAAEHRPGALGVWGPMVGKPCPPAPAEPALLEAAPVPPAAPVPAQPPRLELAVPPAAPVPAEPRPCPRCGKLKRCFCGIPR